MGMRNVNWWPLACYGSLLVIWWIVIWWWTS